MSQIHECALAVVQTFPNTTVSTPQGPVNLRVLMVAIAGVESSWTAAIAGDKLGTCPGCTPPDCNGYTSWGFWQIHLGAWAGYLQQVTGSANPCTWANWLKVPGNEAKAALHVYQTQGLGAWGPDITTGIWLRYKGQAESALKSVGGGNTVKTSPPPTHSTTPTSLAPATGPSPTLLLIAGGVAVAALIWGASTVL